MRRRPNGRRDEMRDENFLHNFHTHTFRCKHATGDVEDYCRAAVGMGMETLGFSDHCALPDDRWPCVRMAMSELDGYVAAVGDAKRDYPGLRVLLGMECEYLAEHHAWYQDELYGAREFDYLVGGPHYFLEDGEWTGTYGGTRSRASLLAYAGYVVSMIESGLFDFIAHPDLFGNCYRDWDESTVECSRRILEAAVANDVGLEINALGLRKIAAQPGNPFPMYPWRPFWELAGEYDVAVIVNSDAHRPEDLQARAGDAHQIAADLELRLMAPDEIGTWRARAPDPLR
jgi:histidinol-phosphatase (PHP family)